MEIVEDIQADRKAQALEESLKIQREYLRQIKQRIDNGENCSTCRFCVCREEKSFWDKQKEKSCSVKTPKATNTRENTVPERRRIFYATITKRERLIYNGGANDYPKYINRKRLIRNGLKREHRLLRKGKIIE